MERYTEWNKEHTHGCGLPGKDCYTKLAKLEDLEDAKRLVELPCKPGDILYHPHPTRNRIGEYEVSGFLIERDFKQIVCHKPDGYGRICFDFKDFGETVFLNKEDAEREMEKELEEMEERV